jgi:hypothetical protein
MPTISINNVGHPAPKWFIRTKKAILRLTVAANAMIASYGFPDQLLTTRIQLWCTIGIVAVLDAMEELLKDDTQDPSQQMPEKATN